MVRMKELARHRGAVPEKGNLLSEPLTEGHLMNTDFPIFLHYSYAIIPKQSLRDNLVSKATPVDTHVRVLFIDSLIGNERKNKPEDYYHLGRFAPFK